jgi:hypothetical protein
VLIRISFGLFNPDPVAGVIPATEERFQIKVTPLVSLVGVYDNKELLQMAGDVKELDNTGVGLTLTVTFCVFRQPVTFSA